MRHEDKTHCSQPSQKEKLASESQAALRVFVFCLFGCSYARVCTELLPFYESLLQLKIPEVASAAAEAVVVVATHLR